MNAPLDVVWDFIQPQFQRSILLLADERREVAGLPWEMLSEKIRAAIAAEIARMSESAARRERESKHPVRALKGLRG